MNREQWRAVWRWMRMEKSRLAEHHRAAASGIYSVQFIGYWWFRGQ
jgi:hypothetical protein